jgi:hypothetical protein
MVLYTALVAVVTVVAAFCWATLQVLHAGFEQTLFYRLGLSAEFWDPLKSWRSKWRIREILREYQLEAKGELNKAYMAFDLGHTLGVRTSAACLIAWYFVVWCFWGVMVEAITTSLVWVTDAWHLFGLLLVCLLPLQGWLLHGQPIQTLGVVVFVFLALFETFWRILRK